MLHNVSDDNLFLGRLQMKRVGRKSPRKNEGRGLDRDEPRRPRFSRELPVLYEDEAVIVVNKPPGMLAVPIKGSAVPSALSLMSERLKARRQQALVVHRIDRFASGILLFAKTRRDRESMVAQFLAHAPARVYFAVVRGRVEPQAGKLVHYFRREGMWQQLRSAKDPTATRAELRYSVQRCFADASLVRVELVTGLQNQIRAQFSAMGHPVIGDRKYHQAEAEEPLIDRVALHAAQLQFTHPRSGEIISVECAMPPDFKRLTQQLSRVKRDRTGTE